MKPFLWGSWGIWNKWNDLGPWRDIWDLLLGQVHPSKAQSGLQIPAASGFEPTAAETVIKRRENRMMEFDRILSLWLYTCIQKNGGNELMCTEVLDLLTTGIEGLGLVFINFLYRGTQDILCRPEVLYENSWPLPSRGSVRISKISKTAKISESRR